MLKLIIKDLTFNKLQVLLGVLVAFVFSFLFFFAAPAKTIGAVLIMVPSILFLQIVGKSCYLDDRNGAYIFLRSLPIPKNSIVLSKYAAIILALAISLVVMFVADLFSAMLGKALYVPDAYVVVVISVLLVYFAVYLWLFFKYDFAAAQHSAYVLIAAWIGVIKLQQYLTSSGMGLNYLYLLPLIAIVTFIVCGKLSINIFAVKE